MTTPTPAPSSRPSSGPSPGPSALPVPDAGLLRFVRGPLDGKVRERLARAVPAEFFSHPGGLSARERQELTYRRLARAGREAPPARELLADPPALCALLERAAVADPALFHVMLLHYTLALGPILRFGAGQPGVAGAREDLESLRSFGTLLMTEAGRSNSHLSPRTTARFDAAAREFVLDTPDAAAAKFPTNSAHPDVPKVAAVYATLVHQGREQGVFVFVVPLRGLDGSVPAGVSIVAAPETSGLQVDYAAVRLSGVRVPYDAWLRDGASLAADGSLVDPAGGAAARLTRSMGIAPAVWRAVISAMAAVTRASAGLLLAHSAGRVTLGRLAPQRPLTDYRNQREAVLGALASAYALTAVAGHVQARRIDADLPPGAGGGAWAPWSAVDRDLALFKVSATGRAQEAVSLCRLHSGAPGFAAVDRLNGYRQLAHAYTNAGGDNELILFDTARAMAEGDRYAPPQVAGAVPAGGDFLDPRVWLHLAGDLERRLGDRLTAGVAEAARAGAEPFAVWNDRLALGAAAAGAFADRAELAVVAEAVEAGPAVMRPLLGLYALDWMERRAGLLLDTGVAGPGLIAGVWEARRRLSDELGPRAAALAAALDPPTELTAPISFITAP
ncbi:acyl-CoA dehydrogenase [Actinomadura parmotrematis]|uniref:Acyl-CoA oxidase C-terminal domain-containing protein n=1 Tax=Actinomadura parmotrematis TaxID=2864039 RepID=A0ABS7FQ99_9ACTN|nr:acyl-CoA dehydrogenase [Actinomadura parmotrematis]MBW8482557.1 hypothetical protein [Actinomadura parmotrematis]